MFVRVMLLWCLLWPVPACAVLPWPGAEPAPGRVEDFADVEAQIFTLVNRERAALGLPPLALHAAVTEVAREHSHAMAVGQRPFGHHEFRERARNVRSLVGRSRVVQENVASNMSDRAAAASLAVQQWMHSDGHREAIHDGASAVTGVGVSRARNGEFFFTQIFVEQPRTRTAGR